VDARQYRSAKVQKGAWMERLMDGNTAEGLFLNRQGRGKIFTRAPAGIFLPGGSNNSAHSHRTDRWLK